MVPNSVTTQTTERDLSFGEKLVGITFNPSNNPQVDRAKQLCAELADIVTKDREKYRTQVHIPASEDILYRHTIGEILNAQMNVVKLLTLK